ncbi:MAG: hypothetical protein JO212_18205, partial [Acetobacteraceae bacterium]|nr:hypothetical protein [Acetobacteraceae bacterium]
QATAGMLLGSVARLKAAPTPLLVSAIKDGFGSDPAGEDKFDCVVGLLCVLNVIAGHRPDAAPPDPWIARWEGWVLAQTSMPRSVAVVTWSRQLRMPAIGPGCRE